ncbi:MAG: diguanylate cyclase [Idiomarina sp.]|nr:diguanylate cyclase [Idiomarina sp.]
MSAPLFEQPTQAMQSTTLRIAADTNAERSDLVDYPVYRDEALEARLDAVIEVGFYPPDQQEFHQILAMIDDSTPIDTYIRAQSYRAYELVMRDGDYAAAHELIRHMKQRVDGSGALEANLEALMTETQIHLQGNELPAAMAKITRIGELSQQVRDPRLAFFANHLIARVLQQNSQYEEALEYFLRAYQVIDRTRDELTDRRRVFVNLNIARLQAELRNDQAALDMADNTIEIAKHSQLHARLADLYLLKGFIEGREGPNEQALASYYQAIAWAEEVVDNRVRLLGRNNAGSILLQMGRFEEARDILQQGLALSESLGRDQDTDIMLFNLAYIDVLEGQYDTGLEQMEAATERYRNYARQAEVADWLEYLALGYERAGRFQEQAQTLLEQRQLREDIFRAERDRVVSALQLRFDTEEQSRQIELLSQRSKLQQEQLANQRLHQRSVILVAVIVVLVVVLIVLVLFFYYRAARRTNVKLEEDNEELLDKSIRDPLTGLLNRRSLHEEMTSHTRLPGEKDALFLIDIDFFKKINDQQGHAAGDEVLTTLASRLRRVCRDTDLVVRWGGEEFLIVLRHTDLEALTNFSKRLLDAVGADPITFAGQPINVTATAGFITLPLEGLSEDSLGWERALQIADLLLYYGKSHGRNQVNGITGLHELLDADLERALFNDISKAIDQNWVNAVHVDGPERH